ncbi:MAG: phosphatidylcholine/phosphatidylserine synthase [Rickettsiales bacterium]|jgi:CDP-diacylglycerol--serine O-phosphatidyltransferase|nr:phosphatidylcholine/phosphatidylserine synthase [Rickettsiales bacterium]
MAEEDDEKSIAVVKLIPHMITMSALCFGLFSVRLSIIGNFSQAAVCIIVACIMDAFDGKVARKLNVSSEFGAQIDSLADFFNFGIAPGFFVYFWKMQYVIDSLKPLSWFPVLLLAICMAIRLARFNVGISSEDPNSPLEKYFFKGCPAPMDAILVMFPYALEAEFGVVIPPLLVIINTVLAALFAASAIPTITPKKMKIRREYKNIALMFYVLFFIGCLLELWFTYAVFALAYLLSVVVGWGLYFKLKKNYESSGNKKR